jgi:hypothetical protein
MKPEKIGIGAVHTSSFFTDGFTFLIMTIVVTSMEKFLKLQYTHTTSLTTMQY